MKKICILVPTYREICSDFFINFFNNLNYYKHKYLISVIIIDVIPVDKARNELVERALKLNPDYVLFWDTDNLSQPNDLDTLVNTIEGTDADVVTGLYFAKKKPYYPIVRHFENGKFWTIDNIELNTIVPVDGCGMGFCLIKADVFSKLKFPYFKFDYEERNGHYFQVSEDLYFCKQLIQNKLKLLCDTRVLLKHVGSTVDSHDYEAFLDIRKRLFEERKQFIKDISLFTKEDYETINNKIGMGGRLIGKEWSERNPKTSEQINEFYQTTPNYIYDLTNWHFGNRRLFDEDLVKTLVKMNPKQVLDYGGGIGVNSHMLASAGLNVTLADINSKTLAFAKFRRDLYNIKYKIWTIDKEPIPAMKYDVILCFDVLEHLPKKELIKTVNKLLLLKADNCQVFITTNFGKTDLHPMHMVIDKDIQNKIEELIK